LGRLGRILSLIGICSYSLYLIHQPFMYEYKAALDQLGFRHPGLQVILGFPLYAMAAILAAWVMYVTVERGGIRVGKWLLAKRSNS